MPNIKIAIFDYPPPPTEGFPWDDLRKIFRGCQWIAKVSNGEEKLSNFNRLSRAHERYRRQTDRQNGDSIIANVNVSLRSLIKYARADFQKFPHFGCQTSFWLIQLYRVRHFSLEIGLAYATRIHRKLNLLLRLSIWLVAAPEERAFLQACLKINNWHWLRLSVCLSHEHEFSWHVLDSIDQLLFGFKGHLLGRLSQLAR